MGNCDEEIDCEVNHVIDQILREDRLESMGLNACPNECEAGCEEMAVEPHKNCAIETSARFSIRILEALRAVQRQKSAHTWASCTMEEIVQYIRRHYYHDGDLCSQVETALDQVTAQGFVLRMGANRYHLIGPFACSVPKPPAPGGCRRNRPSCGARRPSCRRRRRACTPTANSSFADCTDCPALFSLNRLSTVSDIEDPSSAGFQNKSNRERSLVRGDDRPFNENQELSMLEEIRPPGLNRPDVLDDRGREPRDHPFDQNMEEVNPPVGNAGRPGVGARERVVRDRIFDENVAGMYPPGRNEQIQRLGGCEGCGEEVQDQSSDENVGEIEIGRPDADGGCRPVAREHSSDENMYCVEPAMNETRGRRPCRNPRRRRRRDCSSSKSSTDSVISRCPAPRSRSRNNFGCSSDADVSDESDVDETSGAKPWVRRCQYQNNQKCTRRGRSCSSRI